MITSCWNPSVLYGSAYLIFKLLFHSLPPTHKGWYQLHVVAADESAACLQAAELK